MTIALFVEHCTLYYMKNNIKGINMGIMKEKYIEEQIRQEESCPQHVIDEAKVEEAIERMKDRQQMEMYDDETWNWSGLR